MIGCSSIAGMCNFEKTAHLPWRRICHLDHMQTINTGKYTLSLRSSKVKRKAQVIEFCPNNLLLIYKGINRSERILAVVCKWVCKWLSKIVQVACKW